MNQSITTNMGPLDNQIVGSKSVTGIWGAEVRHLEDSTHKVQDFYGIYTRKFHSVVRYLNNQPTGNIAFTVTTSGGVGVGYLE